MKRSSSEKAMLFEPSSAQLVMEYVLRNYINKICVSPSAFSRKMEYHLQAYANFFVKVTEDTIHRILNANLGVKRPYFPLISITVGN